MEDKTTAVASVPSTATPNKTGEVEGKSEDLQRSDKKIEDKDRPSIAGCQIWILKVFIASLIMGCGQFLYATNFSNKGWIGTGFIGPIPVIWLILLKVYFAVRNKLTIGTFINKEKSNIVDPDGKVRWLNLAPLMGNWYGNTAHVFLFHFAYKFAKLGGLNQGVIPIMTIFATIFNTIVFYLAFGEKVSCIKIFGMCFCVSTVIFLAIDANNKKNEVNIIADGETDDALDPATRSAYCFYALGLALLVPVGFSFKHFTIRKFKGSYNYRILPFDSGILENLTVSCFAIYF